MEEQKKKSSNYCFTIHNLEESESDRLHELYESGFVKLLIYTFEYGEKGLTPHIQGFLSCSNMNRWVNVKNKINNLYKEKDKVQVHLEIAKGTSYQNLTYITKELIDNPNRKHVLLGNRPLPPGKKRDDSKFESYCELLEKGDITLKEIETEDLAHYVRHESHYLSIRSKLLRRAVHPPKFVAWFSGTTGTGKSRVSRMIAEKLGFEIYEMGCENNFFNTYYGEECSVWDDYRSGPITFDKLLKITDRDGVTINIKGGKVFYCPKVAIYSSPDGVLSAKTHKIRDEHLDNLFDQLLRRISFTADLKFIPEKKLGYPLEAEVVKAMEQVCDAFLSAYKGFLIENGFKVIVDKIACLKNIESKKTVKLIEPVAGKIEVKTNIK